MHPEIIGYVSDENYVALDSVRVECVSLATGDVQVLTTSPTGALRAELPKGNYHVTLSKDGYGTKWVECELGSGRPSSFRLLRKQLTGFMWPKWVRAGESSEIRASGAEQYQLSLWRYGLEKEYVATLSWFDEHGPNAVEQILPDGDFSQTGVEWNRYGYPSPHPQQRVTAPARSGLYYLWARTPSGERFSFPWVVAPKKPSARIAVLANTNTWNVYNNFGGRSNYINPTGLPATPTVNARLDLGRYTSAEHVWLPKDETYKPLSFERPEPGNHIFDNSPWDTASVSNPIEGRMQCGQAPGEWRLLAWLEREGFDYDYYAEAQLHDGTLTLDAYNVLILGVHPEYWSRRMFSAVEDWVQGGGRLMYLGGNGLNCEVIFEADALRCLSHEDFEENLRTGNESRMHRTYKPESSLLGVCFTNPGAMTAAPYRVLDANHWVFEGTGLEEGQLFGERNLHERVPGGASGHETDKILANSPKDLQHLARGTNPDNGGADMVLLTRGKGQVFSTGSITWVSSLFPDERVSCITKNVLRRFLAERKGAREVSR